VGKIPRRRRRWLARRRRGGALGFDTKLEDVLGFHGAMPPYVSFLYIWQGMNVQYTMYVLYVSDSSNTSKLVGDFIWFSGAKLEWHRFNERG
jgi:hypothetical protein